jgi:hypothetical protein
VPLVALTLRTTSEALVSHWKVGGSTAPKKVAFEEQDDVSGIAVNDRDVRISFDGCYDLCPGNKAYLSLVQDMQAQFLASDKNSKDQIARQLVDSIHAHGGRFLKEDKTLGWVEVGIKAPRKKARQDLNDVKNFIKGSYSDVDVLMGRGGLGNNHAGNQAFLEQKRRLKARYSVATKSEKFLISQELVKWVHDHGGRFLEKAANDRWYIVDETRARKKCRLIRLSLSAANMIVLVYLSLL